MTNVLIISSGLPISAPGERVTIALPPPVVPTSVRGVSRALRVSARRRAVSRAARAISQAMARVRPDVVVCEDWLALEFAECFAGAKVIAVARLAYLRDGTIADSWRVKRFLTSIETTIVWNERDRFALIDAEIYNARVIADREEDWSEEVRQALR